MEKLLKGTMYVATTIVALLLLSLLTTFCAILYCVIPYFTYLMFSGGLVTPLTALFITIYGLLTAFWFVNGAKRIGVL